MHDSSPLVRQWRLLVSLTTRRFGMTIREMATETGVTTRTVRRDLLALQASGFPLEESTSEHGRKHWRIVQNSLQPPLTFTWVEAISLYLGRKFLEPLAGTMFWEGAQSSFRKIRAMLGDSALQYVEKMGSAVHNTAIGISDYAKQAEIIDALMIGIEDRRFTSLTYQSLRATEPVTYDVYPYGLVYHEGSLYLVAFAPDHDEVRHYKIDRITTADVQELRFIKPDDFDLQQHLSESFGIFLGKGGGVQIKVKFAPAVARYIEESTWHPSQVLKHQPDGSLLAEFRLADTDEIKRWIRSFGPDAEVLKPKRLRTEILAEVIQLQKLYERGMLSET